jgi:PEP-CTERM motif-containing protein
MNKQRNFLPKLLLIPTSLMVALACTGGVSLPSASAAELLVADQVMNRILAFDATTGAFSRVLVDSGLDQPTALVMGGGFLYVANLQLGNVLKVDPISGAITPHVSGIVTGPSGLAYDTATDTLLVSELSSESVQFQGERIFRYTSAGELVQTIGVGTGATGRAGMAFDTAGNLYASSFGQGDFFSGSVLKFDGSNNFTALGTYASGNGLTGANGLAFDGADNLYVAGLLSQSVVKYPPGGEPDSGTQFGDIVAYPSGVLLAADGNLLVTSLGNDNPNSPFYPNFLFPGSVIKVDIESGETMGDGPFIGALGEELQGDFVEDELVDSLDLAAWQTAFGVARNGTDFLTWQLNFGNLGDFQPTSIVLYDGTPITATPIPEPSTIWLALLGMGYHCARRFRIRRTHYR